MLVGIIKSTQEPFWLQPADPKEQTPGVRTMRLVSESDKPAQMEVQEVEIVTLEENSSDEVDYFLKRTKLHSKKAYPESTTILLYINKTMRKNKSWRMVYESLKDIAISNYVFILVRVNPEMQKYQLVKVHPDLDIIEFDVMDELQSRPPQKVMKPKRGLKAVIEPLDETHIPFE